MKMCTKCKKSKDETLFVLKKDGNRSSWCKECNARAAKRSRKKNPKVYSDYQKKYCQDNPLYGIYKNMKLSSRARGEGKLQVTHADLKEIWKKQNGICYWSGLPMLYKAGNHQEPKAVSVDRLDLSKPYSTDNIVLCCYWANFGRNSTPVDKWKKFLEEDLKMKGLWNASTYTI